MTTTYGAAEARQGRFQAVFPRAADAGEFFGRLAGEPAGFCVKDGTLQRNRANGRMVTWEVDPARLAGSEGIGAFAEPRWITYWNDLAETVGYYGSTFGEPPWGAGRRTAYLNGRAGTASM